MNSGSEIKFFRTLSFEGFTLHLSIVTWVNASHEKFS